MGKLYNILDFNNSYRKSSNFYYSERIDLDFTYITVMPLSQFLSISFPISAKMNLHKKSSYQFKSRYERNRERSQELGNAGMVVGFSTRKPRLQFTSIETANNGS
jgi:hypothetical protein